MNESNVNISIIENDSNPKLYWLNKQETRIRDLILDGQIPETIAKETGLTKNSVDAYTVKLLHKYDVRDKHELVSLLLGRLDRYVDHQARIDKKAFDSREKCLWECLTHNS